MKMIESFYYKVKSQDVYYSLGPIVHNIYIYIYM